MNDKLNINTLTGGVMTTKVKKDEYQESDIWECSYCGKHVNWGYEDEADFYCSKKCLNRVIHLMTR